MSSTPPRLSIRRAQKDDAGLVLKFIRDLADYEQLLHEVETSEVDVERALFARNPRVFCEIAEWDGQPAGFALWYYTFSTFTGRHGIWLEDLFVEPHFRGHRIGKALMADLAKRCADENLGRLEWWVLDWNESSIAFYKRLGTKMQDEWTVCRLDGEALERLGAGKGDV